MDFSIDPQTQELLEKIQDLVERELYPLEAALETNGIKSLLPRLNEVRGKVKELGLWCPHISTEHGGMGLSLVQNALVSAVLGRCQLGHYAFNCQAPDAGNMEILIKNGTSEQKRTFLEPLLEGRIRSCFAMTEPERPGSNPTWMETSAVKDGQDYVINGRKWFTSSADGASFTIVMAVTDAEAGRYDRASMILVPMDTPGFRRLRNIPIMGHVGEDYCSHAEVLFEDCRVPRDNLLGVEGAGFRIAQQRLGAGRIHHCMRWIGIGERSIELMCQRVADRELAPGRPLASKQIVQTWIADSWAEIRAARLMVLDAAWKMERDGQLGARKEISAIKFFAANVLLKVLDRAIQAHGGLGVTSDTPLAGFFRNERAGRIYDGPDEVHRIVVARELLKQYGVKVTF